MKLSGKHNRAFTLIEILVVIAVIGVLSSVVMISTSQSRMKARDAKRVAQLNQIKNALQMYFNDNGYYPVTSNCGWDSNCYAYSNNSTQWNDLAAKLAPYISSLPTDPINNCAAPWTTGCYTYAYGNVGKTVYGPQYDLTGQLEDTNNPLRCAVKGYKFYFNNQPWCGSYSSQIYEASVN